jgi:hypothetical protein
MLHVYSYLIWFDELHLKVIKFIINNNFKSDVIDYFLENHATRHLYLMEDMYRNLKLKMVINVY